VTDVRASQDTLTDDDPTGLRVLEGVGLSAGNDLSNVVPAIWDLPVTLAQGTFSGNLGTLTLQPHAGFDGDTDPDPESFTLLFGGDPGTGANAWDSTEEVEFAAAVSSDSVIIPEPSAVLLALIGLASIFWSNRR
jgi:hypothetical protein